VNGLMVAYNLIYLAAVAIGLVIFAVIFRSTRPAARAKRLDVRVWERRERAWLYVVIVLLVVSLAATIFETPWRASAKAGRQLVRVTGGQFGFDLSSATYVVGRQVEFRLHSRDVNHAFAIFDPSGTFVTQAQMMPRWDQSLLVTFTKPGRYTIRCFEYCGLGHHVMQAHFEVRA
jgi:cytochrome c oxidase subunit 2